jgi:chromosome partitioning protein
MVTINSLAAAHEVVIPVQCEYYALEGLGQLVSNVDLIRQSLNSDLEVTSIVLVMYDARTRLAEQVAGEVRSHFGDVVLQAVVPRSVRLSEAPSYGQPIELYDPSSSGAVAYREVTREILDQQASGISVPERSS